MFIWVFVNRGVSFSLFTFGFVCDGFIVGLGGGRQAL